jgi:hypothetical protein
MEEKSLAIFLRWFFLLQAELLRKRRKNWQAEQFLHRSADRNEPS